ncbi:MAG: hypothetical protein AAAB35_05250 [Phyllobacterium sp.]|uniref:hypothetical protein n=1 Tax=Phyllobacterium sp. TaxID=1871046 RepID=UPI0030F18C59
MSEDWPLSPVWPVTTRVLATARHDGRPYLTPPSAARQLDRCGTIIDEVVETSGILTPKHLSSSAIGAADPGFIDRQYASAQSGWEGPSPLSVMSCREPDDAVRNADDTI